MAESAKEMWLSVCRAVRPQTDRPLRTPHRKFCCYSFATSLQNCFYFFTYLFALKIAIFSLDCVLLLLLYAVYSCARKPNVMANFQYIVWVCYQALCQIITEFLKEQAIKHERKTQVNSTITSPQQ